MKDFSERYCVELLTAEETESWNLYTFWTERQEKLKAPMVLSNAQTTYASLHCFGQWLHAKLLAALLKTVMQTSRKAQPSFPDSLGPPTPLI